MERAGFTPGGIGAIRRYRSPAAPGTSRQGVVGTGALTMGQWKVLGGGQSQQPLATRLPVCCCPCPWHCSQPCPGWRDPGSLGRLGVVAHVRAEGWGAKLPSGMSVSEWVVMHSLTHMLHDARGARRGQEGIFLGCEWGCTTAVSGREGVRPRSEQQALLHLCGSSQAPLVARREVDPEPKGAQSPDEAAQLRGKSCWGLCLPLSWLWLKQLACGETTGRGQGWFPSKAVSKIPLASLIQRVMPPP